MSPVIFQIRVCQNPECGLRYPLVVNSTFGERCPVCLGHTKPLIEKSLLRDPVQGNDPFPISANFSVLLDNVRSALNVGSIFRSADGFGFHHVYLCGITPTPDNAEVCKSTVGAEQFVKWSVHKNAVELIKLLMRQEYKIWVLERTQNSLPISSAVPALGKSHPLVIVVGNEVTGVDPGIVDIADCLVHIPMYGQKRSFNVAVAYALAAQIIRSQI